MPAFPPLRDYFHFPKPVPPGAPPLLCRLEPKRMQHLLSLHCLRLSPHLPSDSDFLSRCFLRYSLRYSLRYFLLFCLPTLSFLPSLLSLPCPSHGPPTRSPCCSCLFCGEDDISARRSDTPELPDHRPPGLRQPLRSGAVHLRSAPCLSHHPPYALPHRPGKADDCSGIHMSLPRSSGSTSGGRTHRKSWSDSVRGSAPSPS